MQTLSRGRRPKHERSCLILLRSKDQSLPWFLLHPFGRRSHSPLLAANAARARSSPSCVHRPLPADTELEFQVWQEKSGFVEAKDWKRGRFKMTLKAGKNDLGEVKVNPKIFEK